MLVETSVLEAILLEEPDGRELLSRINAAERPVTSVLNAVETAISVGGRIKDYPLAGRLVVEFLEKAGIEIVGLSSDIYPDVVRAYARYGEATGHPAGLDLGDCFSYALSKTMGISLNHRGGRFAQTDLTKG